MPSQITGNKMTTDVTSKYNVDVLFQRPDWRKRSTNSVTTATTSSKKIDWQRAINDKQKSVMFNKFMNDYFK